MTVSGDLPSGWSTATLGDLGDWTGGGTPSKAKPAYWRGGSIPWISPKDMKVLLISDSVDYITKEAVRNSSAKLIPEGSILFVTRSGILAHTLPVARTAVPVAVNQDLKALTPMAQLCPDYIAWAARRFGMEILENCSKDGTTVASVDTSLLQNFRVPIAPTEEQYRIVEAIDSYFTRLDDAVATLERVQRNLKRYRGSVLKAAVEGRLVPTEAELARAEGREYEPASVLLGRILAERRRRWEEAELAKMKAKGKVPEDSQWKKRYREPVSPDKQDLPELPDGWLWASLDEVCPVFVDCAHRTPKYSDSGIPALRPRDVVSGSLDLEGAARVSEVEFTLQTARRVPQEGDVIYSRELSFGWAVQVPPATKVCMSQGMVLFRPGDGLLGRFLVAVLNGPHGRQQSMRSATGSAHPHLNLSDIRAYAIPLPPHAEQRRITAEIDWLLSVGDASGSLNSSAVERVRRLRQAVLSWAFEGKLVDQDSSDEPASVLLERIRAQREANSTSEKGKTRQRRGKRAAKA